MAKGNPTQTRQQILDAALGKSATLGAIFEPDLKAERALAARDDHIVGVVLGYLRP